MQWRLGLGTEARRDVAGQIAETQSVAFSGRIVVIFYCQTRATVS